eukprot:SAG31_NODE_10024_length_1194_cov_1.210959_1_plen_187_part_00
MVVATLKHMLGYSLEQYSPDGNWSEDVYDRISCDRVLLSWCFRGVDSATHSRKTVCSANRSRSFDALIDPMNLEETYTQQFQRAIQKGGAAGVMYSCNMVNHMPAPASSYLAAKLRSWGFDGYRTTDGDGINGINDPHRQNYTTNVEDSIRLALVDGETDIDGAQRIFHKRQTVHVHAKLSDGNRR